MPEYYNVEIKDATEGSASAPIYFSPKVLGTQVLVDGGLIANNPALYAYLLSRFGWNQTEQDIRIVTIGTGTTQPAQIDTSSGGVTKFDWALQVSNLLVVVESRAQEYLL